MPLAALSSESAGTSTMHSLESSGNIPTFILKLWKLVSDDATNNLICWNRSGHSFIIKDQTHFAKELLPLYFKHNNMASFIRQLNMYGFRKLSNIDHGGLKADADDVEFFHQNFIQDQEDQLQYIKRKLSNPKSLTSIVKVDEYQDILSDVESMKGRQDSVDTMLNNMKRENEALWREVAILRQKHMKQQQIVEKLLHFLVSIVRNQVVGGIKRKAPLMIDASSTNNSRKILKTNKDSVCMASSPAASGPIISDITDLENENADFTPVMSDSTSNQLISSLPINLPTSNDAVNPTEETSIIASNPENDVKFCPNSLNMVSLPNSFLDFDLGDVQQSSNDVATDELLDDQLASGLATPQISIESPIPIISAGSPVSNAKDIELGNSSVSTDLILPNQTATSTSSALPRLSTDYFSFNDHVDGIDAELNWLQDQLYGGNLNIDPSTIFGIFSNDDQFANALASQEQPSTSAMLPKAIMDGSENQIGKMIKVEDNADDSLFEELGFNNIDSETKDILSNSDLDLDPSTFT